MRVHYTSLCLLVPQINGLRILANALKIFSGIKTGECQSMYKKLGSRIILVKLTIPITPNRGRAHDCVQAFKKVANGSMLLMICVDEIL